MATALAACLLAGASPAGAALPDLVSDAPTDPRLGTYTIGAQSRLLLRFDSYVHNALGAGPLDVRTVITGGSAGAIEQWEDSATPHAMPGAEIVFESGNLANEDGHDHFHLQHAAEYSLRTADGAALVAPAEKVGFCLLDSLQAGSTAPRVFTSDCLPNAQNGVLAMGVSAGMRDLYRWSLAHQWVDVSHVAPGTYGLFSEVDPDGVVDEQGDEDNGLSAGLPVRVPGHLALGRTAPAGAVAVELATTAVAPMTGALAAPRFRIDAPPAHGTVDKPIGVWFTDPVVRYAPDDAGAPQPDELTYVARAQDSEFPVAPPAVKVLFGGGGDRIAISGAPARMVAGTSVQLQAGPGAVTWRATAGTIGADGRFTAPALAGPVVVRAVGATGVVDEVTITVVPAPAPEPAPVPAGAAGGDPARVPSQPLAPSLRTVPALPRRSIVSASAARVGRFVTVAVVPGRSGHLRIALRRGGRTVSACGLRAAAGRSSVCRLRRPARGRGALRVVVRLTRLDGSVLSRTVPIRAGHEH